MKNWLVIEILNELIVRMVRCLIREPLDHLMGD